MSDQALESVLAQIYVDPESRRRFRKNPFAEGRKAGLSEDQCRSLEATDWTKLEMAARSLEHKRASRKAPAPRAGLFWRLARRLFGPG